MDTLTDTPATTVIPDTIIPDTDPLADTAIRIQTRDTDSLADGEMLEREDLIEIRGVTDKKIY